MHGTSSQDAQALLLSIGAAPIDPALPGQEAADEADRRLTIAVATPEYAELSERRLSGEIDGKSFSDAVTKLMVRLKEQGAFDAPTGHRA